jgi:hypothetical protein
MTDDEEGMDNGKPQGTLTELMEAEDARYPTYPET